LSAIVSSISDGKIMAVSSISDGKIMALIPLKARVGIAALTFAAAIALFVFGDPGQSDHQWEA
jgi:hypothetical protein